MPDQDGDEFVVSDPELIARVRAGDREAFGELYRRHAGPAITLARQFSRSAAESDDLVSESFARVLDNLLAGKGPDTAFRAYLFTTVRNTAYDRTRKDKRLQFTEDMSTHDVAVVGDDPVLANMESSMIAAAFAKLPERWQAVLWHTQVEGESPAEVGALLGMAPGAVSSLAFRAREGLREAYLQAHLAETGAERCRTTVERLGAWTRGGLSKREKAQVDAHLEECDRCRALAAELQEVNTGLRALLAPLILGGAAAGYIATLGPVTPLAAAGTLWPGISGAGAHAAGTSGATGTGAGAAGGTVAGTGTAGAAASGSTAAAAAGTTAGAAAGGTTAAAAAGGAAAGGAGGGAAGAGAGTVAAAGAASAGAAALAATGAAGTAAAQSGAAGGSAAGGSGAGGSGAGGGAAAGSAGASAGGTAAAAGAATGASGLVGALSGVSIVGWVAVGAVAAAAIIAAAVIAVSVGSSNSNSADQVAALSSPSSVTTIASQTEAAAPTDSSPVDTTAVTDTSEADTSATDTTATDTTATDTTAQIPPVEVPIVDTPSDTTPSDTTPSDTTPSDTTPSETTGAGSGPAVLTPTDLTISQELVAGGTGAFTLTVTNTGQQDSAANVPLEITLPQGVTVQSVDVSPVVFGLRRAAVGYVQARAPVQCVPAEGSTCSVRLGVVAPKAAVIVTITVSVDPDLVPDGTTTATVSIFGITISTTIQPDQIQPGISKLTASPSGPFFTPSTAVLGITATPKNGVTKPGPLTFVLTGNTSFGSTPDSCSAVGAAPIQQITCTGTGPHIDGLTVDIGPDQPAGPIPLTVRDAGRRMVAVTNPTQVVPMTLSPIRTGAIIAGFGQTASLDVTNTNVTVPSRATPISYVVPNGVRVTSIDIGALTCTPSPDVPCQLPPVAPNTSTTVTLNLAADAGAPPSTGDLSVGMAGRTRSIPLPVKSPIVSIVATPPSPYPAGSRTTIDLHLGTEPSVVTKVALTLTLGNGASFPSVPAGCDPVGAAPVGRLDCEVTPVDARALIAGLTLDIPAAPDTGLLPLTVDVGGRQLTVLDELGNPLVIAPPATFQLSDVTTEELTAGGASGTASMTVKNIGGVQSSTPINALVTDINDTTDTVEVTAIRIGTVDCQPAAQTCELPPLDHDQEVTVTFQLSATPRATSPTLGIDIGGARQSAALTIVTGIDTLRAAPDDPYFAPSTTPMTITLTPKDGVADAGPVTLTLAGDSTSFTSSAPGCTAVGEKGSAQVTCDGPGISGLGLKIDAGQPPGPLPLTVTDAGSRVVDLTDSTGKKLEVEPGPPALHLDIQKLVRLTAGGSGSITVTAANNGALPTAAAPIHYAFPTNVGVTGIDVDGTACGTVAQDACLLPPVDHGVPRIVTFRLAALPEAATGTAAVTIGGTDAAADLTLDTGIAGLQASPSGPYFAPSTTVLDIAVTPVDGIADPGPLTFTLTGDVAFGAPAPGCTPSSTDPAHQVTCNDRPIRALTLAISREQTSGPLPLTVTDAGDRDVTAVLQDAAGNDLTVQAGPPAMRMHSLDTEPFFSGGTGSASFSVTNDGRLPSAEGPIVFDPPTDVEVTNVQTGGRSCIPAPERPCQLPPVAGGTSTVVLVNLRAAPEAKGGRLTATIDGASAYTDLVVQSAVSGVTVSPSSPYPAPSTTRLTVQVGYQKVVADPGPVTLTLTGGVRFTAVPPACTPTGTVDPAALAAQTAQQVSCDGGTINGLDLTIDRGQAAGPLPLTVTDAAGRRVEVKDDKDHDLEVVRAAPAHLTLTPIGALTFTAGTTGTVAVTVTNNGGQLSDPAPITTTTTAGIDVTAMSADGAVCTPSDCVLPGIQAGHYSVIEVAVSVPPSAHDGGFTVTVGDEPDTAQVTIESGVATVQANPGGPYVIGRTAVITVTATPKAGVGELGQITLQPTGPGLEFQQPPSGCRPTGTGGLLCQGPVIDSLMMRISADASPGPLPLRATDAGGRPLDLTDDLGRDLTIVQPGPAMLDVSGLALTDPAYAGGTAEMRLQVTNGGQGDSKPLQIIVDTPHGVGVSTIAVAGADPCAPSPKSPCTLPLITAGHSVDVTVHLTLDPDALGGTVKVTVVGQADDSATLVVLPGISSLRGIPDDPLPIGATTMLQVSATPQEGVADPGPITFPLVSDGVSIVGYPADCHRRTTDRGVDVIDCTGPVIRGLGVYVGPKVPLGPLPLVADLAGERSMRITDSNGVPLRVGPPLPPGHLVLSAPKVTAAPTAGGTGTLTLTATNTGGQPSTPLPFTVTTPTGVTVSSIQVAGQPSCTPTADQPCVLPSIDPTGSDVITVTLAAQPSAQNGTFTLSAADTPDGSVSTHLTIRSGVSLLVATPATALPAGATSTLRLDATLQPGVTDPGPITFPLQVDGVYVNGYPPDCHSTGAAIECPGPRIDGLVLFVSRSQPAGPLPLQARFAGGQTMAITDSAGHPVQVGAPVPPAHLALSDLQPGQPTIAGGTGTVTLTATNDGGETSQPAPITVTTPPGVAVARIDISGIDTAGIDTAGIDTAGIDTARIDTAAASCTPSDHVPCQLPAITAGHSVQITVALTAKPRAKDGPLTVSAAGATASLDALVVHSGMSSIVATPGGPFAQESTTALTLTAQTTVATPGAITLTLGRGDASFGGTPEGCSRHRYHFGDNYSGDNYSGDDPSGDDLSGDDQSGRDQSGDNHQTRHLTCAGPVIAGLALIVGEHQSAGPLPLTATDAGGRDVPITDQQGHSLTVTARTPAELEPAITQVSNPLTAGGSGGLTMTVHNSGGTASEAATLGGTLPTGIDVASYRIGGTSCTPGPHTTCSVPPVEPGSTTTVAVTLSVGAQAGGGELTFTVGEHSVRVGGAVGGGVSADLPAAIGWQVTDAGAALRAGGSASARVAITNTGGQPSSPRTLLVTPPTGIAISAMSAGDGALCPPAAQTCTLPPIAPGATTTVTAAVTAAPEAHGGSLVLTSGDQLLDIPLTVDAGVQAVIAKSHDALVRGSTAELQVAMAAYPGVTDLGRYVLALRTDQAWFSGYPPNCHLLTSGTEHPTEVACSGASVDGLQLTLSGHQQAGPLPLFAVDAGGRSIPVTDATGAPLPVVDQKVASEQTPTVPTTADGAAPNPAEPSSTPPGSTQPPSTASTPQVSTPVAPTSGEEPSTAPTSSAEPSAPDGVPGSGAIPAGTGLSATSTARPTTSRAVR